jgi:hypothetical protein
MREPLYLASPRHRFLIQCLCSVESYRGCLIQFAVAGQLAQCRQCLRPLRSTHTQHWRHTSDATSERETCGRIRCTRGRGTVVLWIFAISCGFEHPIDDDSIHERSMYSVQSTRVLTTTTRQSGRVFCFSGASTCNAHFLSRFACHVVIALGCQVTIRNVLAASILYS